MSIPELCIKRPVFTTMIILLPVVLGLWAVLNIGVDLFPNVDFPVITVRTTRAGASVEEMEIGVTKPVEEAVNTIAGIDELRSTTKEGVSIVTVQFLLSKNRDIAQQEVQSKVNQILNILPQGTDPPIIDKFDLDATPVMTVAISGKRSLREVTEIADKQLSESLSGLDGVGKVILIGGQKRAVQITIDAKKLEAYGLSIEDVRKAIAAQNLELPGGRVDQGNREDVLRTMGRVDKVSEFMDIIIASAPGTTPGAAAQPIRIRDLGDPKTVVVDSIEEPRSLARLDGDNAVTLVVQKQSGTNTIEVINVVKKKLAAMRQVFDQTGKSDIKMEIIRDQSRFINASLHEVQKHLYIGAILVALTILLFLRDWRTMIMAGIAIPISLLGTMIVIWSLGFTLNNITMLALVLAIGIVIDDAVVVHENIFRWMEEKGYPARQAALYATKEIALAVVATTLSLVVIFLPIAFMSGRVGRFFSSFGITTAVAIMVSLFISFTLTPMLCSRFLKLSDKLKHAGATHHSGGFYGWFIEKPYMWTLRWSMRNRWVIMVLALAVTLSSFPLPMGKWLAGGNEQRQKKLAFLNSPGLLGIVGFDFLPRDDQSEYEITIETPQGYSLERSDKLFKEIEERVRKMPETLHVLSTVGDTTGQNARGEGDVTKGTIYVQLVDIEDRSFSYTTAGLDMLKALGRHPTYLARWSDWWSDAKSHQVAAPGAKGFTQFDAQAKTRAMLAADPNYRDLRTAVQDVSFLSTGGRNAGIEFAVVGPDINTLNDIGDRMLDKLRRNSGLVDVDTTLATRVPEVRVLIDRERASDLGVDVRTVSSALHTLVGGEIVSDYKDPTIGEQYDVWLRASGVDRDDDRAVKQLTIPSTKHGLVRLENVANITRDRGPAQIDRYARQRKLSVVANLNDIPSDAAGRLFVQAFKESCAELGVGADYDVLPQGRARTQAESYFNFMLAFLSSLIFMYMVLAAQFESFTHPITILLALPVTIPFALLSLILLGQPLTLYSVLGLFLLIGIVKKNGILQVDYTNVLRASAATDPSIVPGEYRYGAGDSALAHAHNRGNGHDAPGGNGHGTPGTPGTPGGHGDHAPAAKPAGFFAKFGFFPCVQSLPHEKRVRTWAIIEANRVRLRPILMTTLMLVASMIPIALGVGPGAANRASMAKVIVGGQALSLLLTLLVTPVAYSLFDDFSLLFRRKTTTTDPHAADPHAVTAPHAKAPLPLPARVPEPVVAAK